MFVMQKEGTFHLSSKTSVHLENVGQNTNIARYVTQALRKMHMRPSFSGTREKNCITISLNRQPNTEIGNEGYQLDITPDGIVLSANTEKGLFYGVMSLRQLLPADVSSNHYRRIEIPTGTVLDCPRFEWRGLLVDECHHLQSINEAKRIVDLLASYKMNKLVLQISQGSVWRIALDALPQYADIDAWSTYDFKELKDYASMMQVSLIPQIDLKHIADSLEGDKAQEAVMLQICDEVASLFGSGLLHIGDADSLPARLVHAIEEHMSTMGIRMMCWKPNAIDSLSPNTIVMPRQSTTEGVRAAHHGHDVVMCQEEFCDLYNDQCNAQYVKRPTGQRLSLAKVYRYNPMPSGLSDDERTHILGSMALMLTHKIESQQRMEYTLLPRLCAFAEDVWSQSESKDWSVFRRKIEWQKERIAMRKYNCCAGSFQPSLLQTRVEGGQYQVMLEAEVFGTQYHYTTDGSEPYFDSPIYSGTMLLTKGTLLRVRAEYGKTLREGVYDFVIQ